MGQAQGKPKQPPSSSHTELTPNSDAVARPILAWPWFQTTFCEDPRYRPPDSNASVATVVPWHHFWAELGKLAFSEGLNEVWWAFDDHKLAQPSQRQVFQDHLWGRVQPLHRDNITAADFRAAVDVFSSDGGLADLIESVMRDTPGARADSTLRLRDQVFLSHTGADVDKGSVSLTSAIYHKLRDKWQVMAFYDTHTLEPRDEWRAKTERCVRSSKVVVVVLTPSFFSRYWCMHELDLALHADPEPAKRTIIPVLLGVDRDFHRNARAKYRQTWQAFKQLSGRSDVEQVLDRWENNLQQLDGKQRLDAAAYGMGVKKDWELRLVSQVTDNVLLHVAALAGWQQDLRQPQRHVRDLLPGHLVTNAAALERLRGSIEAACSRQAAAMQQAGSSAVLGRQPVPPHVVQLLGMAGMGKSILALQTAYHYQDTVGCFDGNVHFLRVPPKPAQTDDKAAVTAAAVQLQRDLLLQLQPGAADAAGNLTSPDQLHTALTDAFASAPLQRQTHLLVLDDVWHKDIVTHLRCSTMRGVILLTARTTTWDDGEGAGFSTVYLQANADSRTAANALMMSVLQEGYAELTADKQAVVNDVLRKCDGNMLATTLMAGALNRRSTTAAWQVVSNQFMRRLQAETPIISAIQAALDSLAAAADTDHRAAVQAFDMLRHLQCRLMLPLPLLQLLWSTLHPSEADEDVGVLLDHLLQASLVCRQQVALGPASYATAYYMDALVEKVLARQAPDTALPASPTTAAHHTPSLNKLALLLLGFGRPHAVTWAQQLLSVQPEDGRAITYVGVLQDEVLERPVTALAEEPAGQLNRVLGVVHLQDGQYSKAGTFYRRALAISEKARGSKHLDTATSMNNLAGLLQAQGKLAEAEPLYRGALAIKEEVLGPKHPDTAASLDSMAWLLQAQGKLSEAGPLYSRAVAIREEVLGPKHPETATSVNSLAGLLQAQGKLAAAEPLYSRALAIRQEVLGPKHPDTAASLDSMAWLLQAQGKLSEAEPLYRRALAIREEVLGPKHPSTATSLDSMAGLLQAQGRLAAAEPLYSRALAIREEVLGPKHPSTATSLGSMAGLLQAQGRLAAAKPLYRRALAIQHEALGPNHPDTATCLDSLAGLLQAQGQLAEAERLYRRALAITEEVLGPKHPDTAASLECLAGLLQAQGKPAEAEVLYRRALAIKEEARGPSHRQTNASPLIRQVFISHSGMDEGARTFVAATLKPCHTRLGHASDKGCVVVHELL